MINKNLKTTRSGNSYSKLNYVLEEFAFITLDKELDHELIVILKEKLSTYIQLKSFFPDQNILSRLTYLCYKGVLRRVYNGHIYYQLKRNLKVKLKKY